MSVDLELRRMSREDHVVPPRNISEPHGIEDSDCVAASTTTQDNTLEHISTAGDSKKRSSWTEVFWDTWLLEILSLCLSIGCFIAIVALLWAYQGRIPQMFFYISLNTLVSVLATAAKSFIVSAVAPVLSQSKWCWYARGQDQDLRGFQEFDDASRGPWGSLVLLCRKKNRLTPSTIIATIVMVLAVAYEPFMQNLIKYPLRIVNQKSTEATVRKASTFKAPADSFDFIHAINTGIWIQATQFEEQPHCPSANCQWPTFQSVGWCSTCKDAMPLVQLDGCIKPNKTGPCGDADGTCSIGFGKGKTTSAAELSCKNSVDIDKFRGPVNTTTTVNNRYTHVVWPLNDDWPFDSNKESWLDVEDPVLGLGYVTLKPGAARKAVAVATAQICILSPCLRTYQVAMTDGVATSNVSAIDFGHVKLYVREFTNPEVCWQAENDNSTFPEREAVDPWNESNNPSLSIHRFLSMDEDVNDEIWYEDDFVGMSYNESSLAFCTLDRYNTIMTKIFDSKIAVGATSVTTSQCKGPDATRCKSIFRARPDFVSNFMTTVREHGLNYTLKGVAASLTRLGLDLSNETVPGNETISTAILYVDWPWLILPVIVELTAIILLVLTALVNNNMKTPIWKSSALAILYHGLDESIVQDSGELSTQSRMSASAADTKVRLASRDGKKDRLLLRRVKDSES